MKKTAIIFLLGIMLASLAAITPSGHVAARPMAEAISPKVEVYYFHYSRRCGACRNVENVSKQIVETLYADLADKGEVIFASVNLDDQENHALAERCGATGQSLLVISGEERIDLTRQGIMHARNPERYEEEIKKVIDPLLGR